MPYADKEKQKAYQRQWFQDNKVKQYERNRSSARTMTQMLRDAKAVPCMDCGISYPYYVMHFDHTGDNKVGNISKMAHTCSIQTVMNEVVKCEVVCSNCHAERTQQRLTL